MRLFERCIHKNEIADVICYLIDGRCLIFALFSCHYVRRLASPPPPNNPNGKGGQRQAGPVVTIGLSKFDRIGVSKHSVKVAPYNFGKKLNDNDVSIWLQIRI